MRAFSLFLGFGSVSAGLMACGGGGSKLIDASVPDSPPDAFVCAQRGTLNIPTPLDFSIGGQVQGAVPTSGPQQLTVQVIVTFNGAPTTGFLIRQRNNTGVFAAGTGKAGRFETPPALGTYAMDTSANFGFGIEFVNGITVTGSTGTVMATQVQLLDGTAGGTVKIDTWTPAANPGGTTTIGATFTNATFKGFNVNADGSLDLAGNGCDVTLQNVQFTGMSVKWQAGVFPTSVVSSLTSQPSFDPGTLHGIPVFPIDRE
jgi:hypothetical protein